MKNNLAFYEASVAIALLEVTSLDFKQIMMQSINHDTRQ